MSDKMHNKQFIKSFFTRDKAAKKEVLIMVYKDTSTGDKYFETIEDPEMTFYVNREDSEEELPVSFEPMDKLEPITCKHGDILKTIAYEFGEEKFFWKCIEDRQFGLLKRLHQLPNVHGSDMNIEDYYISEHYKKYPYENLNNPSLCKSYYDIEVDNSDIVGFPEPEEAICPVNLITFYDEKTNLALVFILEQEGNEANFKLLRKEEKKLIERLKKKYVEKNKKYENIRIKILYYQEEEDLIQSFFDIVNELKPDFISGWNSTKFDLMYLLNRMERLGLDSRDIITPAEFDYAEYKLYIDSAQSPKDSNCSFANIGYTTYLDLQQIFAVLRKGMGVRDSYALDAIVNEELDEEKVDYDEEDSTITISNLFKRNILGFIEYGLHDTMLLDMLESKTMDIDLLYKMSIITHTRITEVMKKTTSLKNLDRLFLLQNGMVQSNNHNRNYGIAAKTAHKKVKGAYVGDPLLNANNGIFVGGKQSKYLYNDSADQDFSSMHPNIIMAWNMDTPTQVGRIIKEDENGLVNDEFIRCLTDDLVSRDTILIGERYMGMPSIVDIVKSLEHMNGTSSNSTPKTKKKINITKKKVK